MVPRCCIVTSPNSTCTQSVEYHFKTSLVGTHQSVECQHRMPERAQKVSAVLQNAIYDPHRLLVAGMKRKTNSCVYENTSIVPGTCRIYCAHLCSPILHDE